jgi:hypothetical protein
MKTFRNVVGSFIVIAALGLVSAFAQNTVRLTVDVPFAFNAGSQALPAGQYTFVTAADSSIAYLYDQSGKRCTALMTNLDNGKAPAKGAALVFHRYGNQTYFAGAWSALSASGRVVPETRGEKELAKANPLPEVAMVHARVQ